MSLVGLGISSGVPNGPTRLAPCTVGDIRVIPLSAFCIFRQGPPPAPQTHYVAVCQRGKATTCCVLPPDTLPATRGRVDYLLPSSGIFPEVGNKTERLTDQRHEFPWRFRTSFISPFLSFCIFYHSAFREESRSLQTLPPVSVNTHYMVACWRS